MADLYFLPVFKDMILIACITVAVLLAIIIYIIHGIYTKSFEFEGSIKGFKSKLQTTDN